MNELSEEEKNEIFYLMSQLDDANNRVKYMRKLAFSMIRKYSNIVPIKKMGQIIYISDYTTPRIIKILKNLFKTGVLTYEY